MILMIKMLLLWYCMFLMTGVFCQDLGPEILENSDFESEDFTGNWFCNGCQLESHTDDKHEGQRSAKISARGGRWSGVSQNLDPSVVKTDHRYYFSTWVKMLNDVPGKLLYNIHMTLNIGYDDDTREYPTLAKRTMLQFDNQWFHLSADFKMPSREPSSVILYLQNLDTSIDYLVDDASLKEIFEETDWREKSDANIERYRKNHLNISVNIGDSWNKDNVKVDVVQKTHAFAFGTAVRHNVLTNSSQQKYKDFLKDHFNYAVIENALKWKQVERVQGQPDFTNALAALDVLEDLELPVRGHCIFWGVPANTPEWLFDLDGEQVAAEIDRRLDTGVNSVRGRLTHWDVNNENLHGIFFEEKTNDTGIINYMFQGVRERDPDIKLFLNEYEVVNSGALTEAYLLQTEFVKNSNVDLYGIGIQSHIPRDQAPDPTNLRWRLNVLARAEVPIWVTEMTTSSPDENLRADWYETCLRVYFGFPQVEGILIWGFWGEHHYNSNAGLVSGPEFRVNAAGERWIKLLHEEWNTTVSHMLSDGEMFSGRFFHGAYDIVVTHNDNVIHEQSFTMGKEDAEIEVDVPNP